MNPAVVFVHGLYHTFAHLRGMDFPAPCEVIILDLAGFGEHQRSEAPETLGGQVEHVVAEMDLRAVERATLVGHSIGGAIAMLAAAHHPGRVAGVVNVEGNFTMADAFWSAKVAAMSEGQAATMLEGQRADPLRWVREQGIDPTPQRIAWTRRMLDAQPASAIQSLARAVVEETKLPSYLATIERVLENGTPLHLLAGERSRAAWSVPDNFLHAATTFTTQPRAGHMMTIEEPGEFLRLVAALLR